MNRSTVLIVEDEAAQVELLSFNLRAAGFDVAVAGDGNEALQKFDEIEPDILLLDWMLPGVSGLEVCRRIRFRQTNCIVPIIIVSARTEEEDRIRGLDSGADDYVIKPYSIDELLARIKANLRRTRPSTVGQKLVFRDIELDSEQHRVFRDGREIKLGPTEFRLLATFLERPGRVWSREQLLDRVWGRNIHVEIRTVDVHMVRLRKALRRYGGDDPLRTVRGAGYSLG